MWRNEEMYRLLTRMNSLTISRRKTGKYIHPNNEKADIKSGAPLQSTDFVVELPSLDFPSYIYLPQADHAILIPTDNPSAVWANAQASYAPFVVRKPQGSVVREWLKATWTGQLGNQAIGIDIQLCALDTWSEIEVKLATEAVLDKAVIRRNEPQRRVFLRKVIFLSIFRVLSFPLGALCISR